MAINTIALKRRFSYNGMEIPDPGSSMSATQVRDLFSATYPELTSAAVDGPKIVAGVAHYEFIKAVHDKGA